MLRSRTLLSLSALLAGLGVLLLATPASPPAPAYAAECDAEETGTLIIRIIDVQTEEPLTFEGTEVLIKPDPTDFELDKMVTDTAITDAGALTDKDQDSGVIRIDGACSTEGSEEYSAVLYRAPSSSDEECDAVDSSDKTQLDPEDTAVLELSVECMSLTPTATLAPSATSNPTAVAQASTVLVSTAASAVNCGASTVVAVLVRNAAGEPVAGAPVSAITNIGSLSPPSKATDANGIASLTFVAPAAGGTATIAASSGTASDTAQVAVNCISDVLSSNTQAPGGSIIRPPSTGNGGLVNRGN
jgi:hypothetical protein